MKSIPFFLSWVSLLTLNFVSLGLSAQVPQKFNYQAVIRNASGALVTQTTVSIRVSILTGSATGTSVYTETHQPTTNANGLATLAIGGGTVISGSFLGINWAAGPYFIKTETDPSGGTSYSISGTSELLSVPYALYSGSANFSMSTQTLATQIPDQTDRNFDVFTPDSLVVSQTGTYLIQVIATGIFDNFFAANTSTDPYDYGSTFKVHNLATSVELTPQLPFLVYLSSYVPGNNNAFMRPLPIFFAVTSNLTSGDIIKCSARVDATGPISDTWGITHIRVILLKIS